MPPSPYTMKDLVKLKEQVAWLISQVKCFMGMFPSATAWTNQHSATTGNKYLKDTLVWHDGFIYKCLIDNNGNPTNNSFYWQKMGKGWLIQQEQADFNATSGPSYIRNIPVGMGGPEADPIFQAWLAGNPLGSYYLASNPAGYISSYTETDPVFSAWQLANDNHANWNTAYGWGNHALAGYLTSFTESDPVFVSWLSGNPFNGYATELYVNSQGFLTAITGEQVSVALKDFYKHTGILYHEEFMGSQQGSVSSSYGQVITLVNGAGALCQSTGTITNKSNQQGVVRHSTGSTTTGFAGYTYGNTNLFLGLGEISIETYATIDTLSTATDRFFTYFGYGVPSNWTSNPNCIFFSYDEGGQVFWAGTTTPNWKCYSRSGSTVTVTNSGIVVNAQQWYKLRININSAANIVRFYIDGVLVATHSTNIPPTTVAMSLISIVHKVSGTNQRTMQTDYFNYEEIFTNPR